MYPQDSVCREEPVSLTLPALGSTASFVVWLPLFEAGSVVELPHNSLSRFTPASLSACDYVRPWCPQQELI